MALGGEPPAALGGDDIVLGQHERGHARIDNAEQHHVLDRTVGDVVEARDLIEAVTGDRP